MEILNEVIPFGVGVLFLSPLLMFLVRTDWSSSLKFAASFGAAMITGAAISLIMGELAGELPEAVTAIIIDTSLAYTGSQLAYWLIWRAVHERKTHTANTLSTPRR